MVKISSMLFICKSFFQLYSQKVPRAGICARSKQPSEARSLLKVQVSVLGRGQACGVGKMGNFGRTWPVLAVVCLSVLGPGHAAAQELDAARAMDVYRAVDGWVRNWGVSQESVEGLPAIACASVTLRLDGQVIGRGQVVRDDADTQGIVLAARGAMAQGRAWVRAKSDLEPTDDEWAAIGSRVVLSVELVDRVVPMSASSLGLPGLGLSPGVHGLVMRLGDQAEVMTPDEMITLGLDVESSAYSMATVLSGDGGMALASIEELIGRGYWFGRCEPVWIAQGGAGLGGVFIDRGGRVIEGSSVGMRSVRDMGERIAGYLVAQRWPGSERFGMVGARDVVSGRATPEVASVYEQAISATALLRFAKMGKKPIHNQSREYALQILKDLGAVEPGEQLPWEDGIGSAACVIALSFLEEGELWALRASGDEDLLRLQERCLVTLAGLYSPIDGYSDSVPMPAWGLVSWALVRSESQYASRAVRSVFQDTTQGQLVGQMPFLGWAELGLAEGEKEVPAAGALEQMRSRMWAYQIKKSDLDWRDRDFAGAVVFTTGSNALPTSGNLRPIAMVSSMLGDERLTPGTIADGAMAAEIGRVASAMRFVDQLVMDERSGFVSRAPDRCIGGVRESLWEWKVSPAWSAIALLGAVEFERSIQEIGARPMPARQP